MRIGGKKSKANRIKPVTARQIRKTIRRSQLRIGKKTLEVKRLVSKRGRTHLMEAEVPGITKTQPPQELLLYSTAIKRFKYWEDSKRLRIWFVKGGVYDYFKVPEAVVITLSEAQSKGNYFYYNIRMSYNYERIR
jgi:hypothetical protein